MDTAGALGGIGAGVGRQKISDLLGGASIVCWLFAQLPQVAENYRNSSVDGLALPFLVSWLLGDVTNLIGCVLTNQLPFQTYLATYFTIIDIILMLQYLHYTRQLPHTKSGSTASALSTSLPSPSATAPLSASSDLASRKHRYGHRSRQTSTATVPSHSMSASWMTDTSQHRPSKRKQHHGDRSNHAQRHPPLEQSSESLQSLVDPPQQMVESFHSEISRKTGSSSAEATVRGRPNIMRSNRPSYSERHSHSREQARQADAGRGPSQSRTRSVVFLSIFALVGIGRLTMPHAGLGDLARRGSDTAMEPAAWALDLPAQTTSPSSAAPLPDLPVALPLAVSSYAADKPFKPPQEPEPDYPFPHEIDIQRLIGRISAWICVVFYLTSRMPQIWKNFQRRSCEGLSILLFIAAFHGNLFYVISILSSPLVQTEDGFLVESTPFLIGSGGTLIFDLTILFQSCIYAGRAPKHAHHHHQYHSPASAHRRSRMLPEGDEEIAAFLAPESDEEDEDERGQREPRYRQRRRSGSPRPHPPASRRRSSSRGKSKSSSSAAMSKSWHGPPLPLSEPDVAHPSRSRSRSRPRTTADDPPSTA